MHSPTFVRKKGELTSAEIFTDLELKINIKPKNIVSTFVKWKVYSKKKIYGISREL